MKIVSVMTTHSRGGAEFAAMEMLDALVARGHEAVMLTNQPEIGRDTRVAVRPIELGAKLSVSSFRSLGLRFPALLRQLRRALAAEAPYDVLLVHYKKEQLLAALLPPRLRPTLAWAEWGPVPFPMRRGSPQRAYLAAARRADVVMAISEGTRRNVIDVGVPSSKVHVVHNVMRSDDLQFRADGRARVRAELEIADDAFVVGCISRFHPKKRNDVVLEAVKRLDRAGAHLVLAGDGETEGALRAQARPLDGRAHFVPTPGGDVADVLSAFDVSVFCPSPTEGAPRAVILGMLAGRPCVSTGAEGVSDMIFDDMGAITSPENDAGALAEVLERYAADPALRAAHGRRALERALETYDAPVVAERIERLLTRRT